MIRSLVTLLSIITALMVVSLKQDSSQIITMVTNFTLSANSFAMWNPNNDLMSFLKLFPSLILLTLFSALSAMAFNSVFKVQGSHNGLDELKQKSFGYFCLFIFLFEEGLFRILPLFLSGWFHISPFVLLMIFNLGFALIHLSNFKGEKRPSALITLPQLFAGFIFAMVLWNFGIAPAVILHILYDFCLFATMQEQKFGIVDIIMGSIGLAEAFFGYNLLKGDFSQITNRVNWVNSLQGQHLGLDVVIGSSLFFSGLLMAFIYFAGLDTPNPMKSTKVKTLDLIISLGVITAVLNVVVYLLINNFDLLEHYSLVFTSVVAFALYGFNKNETLSQSSTYAFSLPVSALSLMMNSTLDNVFLVLMVSVFSTLIASVTLFIQSYND